MNHICSDNNQCIGCTACRTICHSNAIKMVLNEEGFYIPSVDEEKCLKCGKCLAICPMQKEYEDVKPIECWAGWNNSLTEKAQSTSGAMFSGIANTILMRNGIVFGAVYASDNKSVYHTDTDHAPLVKLQKSKYVTSNLANCFERILNIKKTERQILFVGTPCQCAGLRSLIGEDGNNIYLIDFICGGTPSAKAFREYVEYKENKIGSPIIQIDFRGKTTGWKKQYFEVEYENGKTEKTFYLYDPYFSLFNIEHLSTRRECSHCKFRHCHQSDITIADFWGVRATHILDDDTGISMIAINTKKGKELFDSFSSKTVFAINYNDCSYAFEDFPISEQHDIKKDSFLNELSQNNFSSIMNRYIKTDYLSVFIRRVRSRLGV